MVLVIRSEWLSVSGNEAAWSSGQAELDESGVGARRSCPDNGEMLHMCIHYLAVACFVQFTSLPPLQWLVQWLDRGKRE